MNQQSCMTKYRCPGCSCAIKVKKVSNRHRLPWFSEEIGKNIWRKSGKMITPTATNSLLFTGREGKCHICLMYLKRPAFDLSYAMPNVTIRSFSISVTNYITEMQMFDYLRGLCHNSLHRTSDELFTDKIKKIRISLRNSIVDSGQPCAEKANGVDPLDILTDFSLFTTDDVRQLISSTPNKSCEINPEPTSLLRVNIDAILPLARDISNKSLQQVVFPSAHKEENIKSHLKKINLNLDLKNCPPVSNLRYLSKVLERVALERL